MSACAAVLDGARDVICAFRASSCALQSFREPLVAGPLDLIQPDLALRSGITEGMSIAGAICAWPRRSGSTSAAMPARTLRGRLT